MFGGALFRATGPSQGHRPFSGPLGGCGCRSPLCLGLGWRRGIIRVVARCLAWGRSGVPQWGMPPLTLHKRRGDVVPSYACRAGRGCRRATRTYSELGPTAATLRGADGGLSSSQRPRGWCHSSGSLGRFRARAGGWWRGRVRAKKASAPEVLHRPAVEAAWTFPRRGLTARELLPIGRDRFPFRTDRSEEAPASLRTVPGGRRHGMLVAMAGKAGPGSGDPAPTVHGAPRVAPPAAMPP